MEEIPILSKNIRYKFDIFYILETLVVKLQIRV